MIEPFDCGCYVGHQSDGYHVWEPCDLHDAAADLLTACKALVAALENGAVSGRLVDEARQIINRAELNRKDAEP